MKPGGREKSKNSKERLDVWLLSSINRRLAERAKRDGKTKTQIVEETLFLHLNRRDREDKEDDVAAVVAGEGG